MKRGLFLGLIIVILLVNINQIYAAESDISSDFNILGCRMNNEFLTYNSCSRYGLYWCNDAGRLLDVFTETDACGGINPTSEDDCCPPSYFCNSGKGKTNICEPREYDCSHFIKKNTCEDNGCYWFEKELNNFICVDRRQLSSCSDYVRNASCIRDLYGLGKTNGLGTDVCRGIYFGTKLTVINSCKCEWKGISETNGNCSLAYNVLDEFDPYKNFTCNKQFSLGICNNGQQTITWNITSFSQELTLTDAELTKFKCTNGTKTILCDYSTVKLPFFGLYNFIITSVLIIFAYIYLNIRRYKKTK